MIEESYSRKLPPATGNYTTLRVEMSTTEIMEDICPYFGKEATTENVCLVLCITVHENISLY